MRTPIESDDPEYWCRRAQEARARAEEMISLGAKEGMRHKADTYDKISIWISERESRHAEIRTTCMARK